MHNREADPTGSTELSWPFRDAPIGPRWPGHIPASLRQSAPVSVTLGKATPRPQPAPQGMTVKAASARCPCAGAMGPPESGVLNHHTVAPARLTVSCVAYSGSFYGTYFYFTHFPPTNNTHKYNSIDSERSKWTIEQKYCFCLQCRNLEDQRG